MVILMRPYCWPLLATIFALGFAQAFGEQMHLALRRHPLYRDIDAEIIDLQQWKATHHR